MAKPYLHIRLVVSSVLLAGLACRPASAQTWIQGLDVDGRDPLEISTTPVISTTNTIDSLVLYDQPGTGRELDAYQIPIDAPDQALRNDVLSDPIVFALSHYIHRDPGTGSQYATVIVDQQITLLESTTPLSWSTRLVDTAPVYFSSEIGLGDDTIYALAYDAFAFKADVFSADTGTKQFSLNRTVKSPALNVVDSIFNYPRMSITVDPDTDLNCVFTGELTAVNIATYFYNCSNDTVQAFDTVPRAPGGFPESIGLWKDGKHLYAYVHNAAGQIRLIITDGSPTFQLVVVGTAPQLGTPPVTPTMMVPASPGPGPTVTMGPSNSFFGIGMTCLDSDTVVIVWPGSSALVDLPTGAVTPLSGYPFDGFAPNAVTAPIIGPNNGNPDPLAFALGRGSLGSARLTFAAGVAAPTLNQLATVALAFLLLILGVAIRRDTRTS